MIADILNLSIVKLLIHRNRKIASEMKCDSFYGFFLILLYQSSEVFYHIFFIIFIVIFTVKNIQYINVIMNNHIATGSQIRKTDTENPPNKKPILKQQNNKNSYIKPKRSYNLKHYTPKLLFCYWSDEKFSLNFFLTLLCFFCHFSFHLN